MNNKKTSISEINIAEARGEVARRIKKIEDSDYATGPLAETINTKFGGKIATETDFTSGVIHAWTQKGIIKGERKGKGAEYIFSFSEVKKIMMAHYLWQRDISLKQIAAAVQYWADPTEKSNKEVQIDIGEMRRAKVILAGRLLGVVISLAAEIDGPPRDCILMCRELTEEEKDNEYGSGEYLRKLTSKPQFDREKILIGYVKNNPQAEMLTGIEDFTEFVPKMSGLEYRGILIAKNKYHKNAIELLIGFPANVSDQRAKLLLSKHSLKQIPRTPQKADLLYKILGFLYDKFFDLENIFKSNDRRYHLLANTNQLTALTTVVLLSHKNLSSSVFWTKEDGDHLTIRCYSPGFTSDAGKILTLAEGANLESLVYKAEKPIICDDISDWEKRLPKEDNYIPVNPFIIVPAFSSTGIEGVVFVSAEYTTSKSLAQDIDLLQALADVLAEAYAREMVSSVDHIVSYSSFESGQGKGEGELLQSIITLLKDEKERQIMEKWEDLSINEYVLFCVIKVEAEGNRSLRRWYDGLFSQIIAGLVKQGFYANQQEFNQYSLFRIEPGNMILLIPRCESRDSFEALQESLTKEILRIGDSIPNVKVSTWLVYFPYSYLISEMKKRDPVEDYDLEQISQKLINTTKATFKIARLLMNAEHQIVQRDYLNARIALSEVSSRTDIQEGLPFIYRRLFDACSELEDWKDAYKYALKAVEIEKKEGRPFAGSHIRLAKALEHLGDIPRALEEYKEVVKLSREPAHQLDYARALILNGQTDDQYGEAESILNAIISLPEVADSIKAYATFLRMKAERKLHKDESEISNSLKLALRYDRNNQIISWEKDEFDSTQKGGD